jgi:molecular chaperone GrpE
MREKKNTSNQEEPVQIHVVDKRHFADLDSIPLDKTAAEEKPRYPSFVEELMSKLEVTERSFEEKKLLMQTEIQRTRARLEADYARSLEIEKQKQILPFLEVLDNLERAVQIASNEGSASGLLEGIRMTTNLFRSKLQGLGVEPIPMLRQPFDPNLGQAVGVVEVSDPSLDGVVVDELLCGYRCGEQLVRPAQVRVGRYVPSEHSPE